MKFKMVRGKKEDRHVEKRGQARRPEAGLRASPLFQGAEPVPIFLLKR